MKTIVAFALLFSLNAVAADRIDTTGLEKTIPPVITKIDTKGLEKKIPPAPTPTETNVPLDLF